MDEMAGLPLELVLLETKPEPVSLETREDKVHLSSDIRTVLAILRAGKVLQTRIVERCEGHPRHRSVSSHLVLVCVLLAFDASRSRRDERSRGGTRCLSPLVFVDIRISNAQSGCDGWDCNVSEDEGVMNDFAAGA